MFVCLCVCVCVLVFVCVFVCVCVCVYFQQEGHDDGGGIVLESSVLEGDAL